MTSRGCWNTSGSSTLPRWFMFCSTCSRSRRRIDPPLQIFRNTSKKRFKSKAPKPGQLILYLLIAKIHLRNCIHWLSLWKQRDLIILSRSNKVEAGEKRVSINVLKLNFLRLPVSWNKPKTFLRPHTGPNSLKNHLFSSRRWEKEHREECNLYRSSR